MMKICVKCGSEKLLDDFYKKPTAKDGRMGKCKECTKLDTKRNILENRDYYRQYEKARGMLPHRVQSRKEYMKTEAGKKSLKMSKLKYIKKHPERISAPQIVKHAIRRGDLVPWPGCAVPDCINKQIQAHHPDYSRPLDVVWLCRIHHRNIHSESNERKKNESR